MKWAQTLLAGTLLTISYQPVFAYDPFPGPSPWGPGDQAGATNTQNPQKVKEMALEILLSEGKVYRLGHEYEYDMPTFPGNIGWDFETVAQFIPGVNQAGTSELLHGELGQLGTQLDSLGHFAYLPAGGTDISQGLFYNQFTGDDVVGDAGLLHLGVEHLKPMITRGIILDVKRHANGGQRLVAGQEITVAMLQQTLAAQGLKAEDIQSGDAVLIVTGHEELWETGRDGNYYIDGGGFAEPGIGLEASQWLASLNITCVGMDNWGIDVQPPTSVEALQFGIVFPAHHELLVKNGIPLQESMHLGDLAEDISDEYLELRSHGIPKRVAGKLAHIFAYIQLPVPVKGATGSVGVPVAIR